MKRVVGAISLSLAVMAGLSTCLRAVNFLTTLPPSLSDQGLAYLAVSDVFQVLQVYFHLVRLVITQKAPLCLTYLDACAGICK